MRPRWYVSIIAIGSILNVAVWSLLWRRRKPPPASPQPDRTAPPLAGVSERFPVPSQAPSPAPPQSPTQTMRLANSSRTSLASGSQARDVGVGAAATRNSDRPSPRRWLPRLAIWLTLLAAVALAAQAQARFSIASLPLEQRDAGIPYALAAMAFFSLAAWLADHELGRAPDPTDCPTAPHKTLTSTAPTPSLLSLIRRHPWRAIGLLISSGLAVVVLGQLRGSQFMDNRLPALVVWLISIGLFITAVIGLPTHLPRDWRSWWKQHWLLVAVVGTIGLLALALRVIDLGGIPPTLGGDEGSQGVEALKILRGELRNPFITTWMSVPTMSFFFNALTIGLLGHTAEALRLPWALIGAATVLIVFALTRRLKGLALGALTATLLAAYHYHIHFSRLGSNQVADAFFMALAFLFLYRAYDQGGLFNWVMAGVVAGAAQYFYAGARFTTIMVGVTVAYFIVRERRPFVHAHWRGLLALLGAFLITAAPMVQYAALNPNEYNGRLNAVGIYQSGWMDLAKRVTGQSEPQLLLDQFKRAVLAYNAYPDRTSWYGSPLPLFDGLWAILFMLGLGYATLRPFDRRLFPMLIWWWGAIILGGMLTESPPSSQRLITSAPPAVFFVALAVWKSGQIIRRLWPIRRVEQAVFALTLAITAVLCGVSVNGYFVTYTPSRVYGNWSAVTASEIVKFTQENLDATWQVVFLGAPQMYIDFGSIKYLQPDLSATDWREPLSAPLLPDRLPPDKNLAFIVLPARQAELDFIRQTYPAGELSEVPSPLPDGSQPAFFVYRVVR